MLLAQQLATNWQKGHGMKIAIDGPAASGKGTLARTLAMALSFDYLDTGTLYRAVARDALTMGLTNPENTSQKAQIITLAEDLQLPVKNDESLRNAAVSDLASQIASISEVRDALIHKQRDFAANPPSGKGAILDGRDIGTVILPDADLKFFIDADIEVRAKRRFLEMSVKDENLSFAQVLADLSERDARDKNRTTAPLIAAKDAISVDTTQKNAEEVLQLILEMVRDQQ